MPIRRGSTDVSFRVGGTAVSRIHRGASEMWSSFAPTSLAGLELWLDAADAGSVTLNGSGVSQWSDKSGKARHASQGTAANQPVYSATGMGGKPAVSFTGSQSHSMYGALPVTATGMTTFVVFDYNNAANSGNNRLFALIMSGSSTDFSGTNHLSPLLRYGGVNSAIVGPYAGGNICGVATPGYDTPLIYSLVADGTSLSTRINNGAASTASRVLNTQFANFALASYRSSFGSPDAYGTGKLSEIIVYSRAVSDSERASVAGYLSQKWSITLA